MCVTKLCVKESGDKVVCGKVVCVCVTRVQKRRRTRRDTVHQKQELRTPRKVMGNHTVHHLLIRDMRVSINGGTPKWMVHISKIFENPIKIDDLGVP